MIAICVIAYNRISSLRRLLQSLDQAYYPAEEIPLVISIDKSETDEVEKFAENFIWKHGNKKVIKHPVNLGLRKHVISCGNLLSEYEALIVLEDDIFVAKSFYYYAKACVHKYENDDMIAGISLYNFRYDSFVGLPFYQVRTDSDVYLMQLAQSWGQVWMKRQWLEFKDWYDKNENKFNEIVGLPPYIKSWPESSWLKYHTAYCIQKNKYFIYPYDAYSTCFAEAGTHTGQSTSLHQSLLFAGDRREFRLNPTVVYDAFREFKGFGEVLGIPEEDLCVDFYGLKDNSQGKRFWLTKKKLKYNCLHSFGLEMRPYELNVLYGIPGDMLFLYDTTNATGSTPKTVPQYFYDLYHYNRRIDILWNIREYLSKIKKFIIKKLKT